MSARSVRGSWAFHVDFQAFVLEVNGRGGKQASFPSLEAAVCFPLTAGRGTVKRDPQPFTSGSSIARQPGLAGPWRPGDRNCARTASVPGAVIAPALTPVLI